MKAVLFCGSRSLYLNKDARSRVERAVADLEKDDIVITGGARGADLWADESARRRGLAVTVFYPNWSIHGPKAGPFRNRAMVYLADRTIKLAQKDGVPVKNLWKVPQ